MKKLLKISKALMIALILTIVFSMSSMAFGDTTLESTVWFTYYGNSMWTREPMSTPMGATVSSKPYFTVTQAASPEINPLGNTTSVMDAILEAADNLGKSTVTEVDLVPMLGDPGAYISQVGESEPWEQYWVDFDEGTGRWIAHSIGAGWTAYVSRKGEPEVKLTKYMSRIALEDGDAVRFDWSDYYEFEWEVTSPGAIDDSSNPIILPTYSPQTLTNGAVTITGGVKDQGPGIMITKWAYGDRTIDYFIDGGYDFDSNFIVTENGTYTIYAKDNSGKEAIKAINISNIIKPSTFSFARAGYTAVIPEFGLKTIIVAAMGMDIYGNMIPPSDIRYSLASTYGGISIDSSTGAITIKSSAQLGSVRVDAAYQNLTCSALLTLTSPSNNNSVQFSAVSGRTYDIALAINNVSGFNGLSFVMSYDSSTLEAIDLCSTTKAEEISEGLIPGTGITITDISPGNIVMTVDRIIPDSKQKSCVINIIKFRAKATGQTSITAEYN